jgi:hypothetical protein
LVCRQTMASQTIDEGTLLRDVADAVLNVPLDHVEFGFAFSHRVRIANVTRPGSIPRLRTREMTLRSTGGVREARRSGRRKGERPRARSAGRPSASIAARMG